ncbi:MAG: OmpA family protein [Thiohalophilus sp.]|uniref:flagellar protein MotY n=1 Tax=Thiohalophilus sp. TaxID=3028392 RepID=UPI0028703227|nr:OmpA family protein [Thiohalophilus sp.]MDR9437197.1 OmpA family protein [Thiohalophilus sp.]
MRRVFSMILLGFGLLSASSSWAGLRIYSTPLADADWQLQGTALICRLTHEIAGYGVAEFRQQSDGRLVFQVQVEQPASATAGEARLLSLPASWQHYEEGRDLGDLPVVPGKIPFYLGESGARRVMAELEVGLFPTLIYKDWVEPQDVVRVRLSPLGFSTVVDEFRACVEGLLPYTYEDVRKTVLLYKTNQTRPSRDQRDQLDQLVRYLRQDGEVEQVRIEGYTDSLGLSRINLVVANQRVDAVQAYLVEQGVDAGLITTRAYEETEAKFDNRTEAGRRKNRRVEIILSR